MRSAELVCGSEAGGRIHAEQTPYPSGDPSSWVHSNEAIEDSPAYGRMSSAELSACLQAYGYNRVDLPTGYGNSTPPAR